VLTFNCKLRRPTFMIDVAFNLPQGSIYALFGPSAAGKSSILSVISGFETKVDEAYLSINNRVILDSQAAKRIALAPWETGIVLVEQGAQLFPHLTVAQNIQYGQLGKSKSNTIDTWHQQWIERLGLAPYLQMRPSQLSGGLIQRAVFARAIATRPEVLLLDEPFSALDANLRRIIQDAVRALRDTIGTTVIMVTHQLSEAQRMADVIGVLAAGRILQEDQPFALLQTPRTFDIARMLGYTHLLTAADGQKFALHPSRVIAGEHAEFGPILRGRVSKQFPQEGATWIELVLQDTPCTCIELCLPVNIAVELGQTVSFTAMRPPIFA